jgi:carbamoyl-phosphate synthase large subunit
MFLVGTSIYGDSVAPAFCDRFELAPPTEEDGYVDWLLSTIKRHTIEMLVPGLEIDMYKWVEHRSEFARAGAVPMLNASKLIGLCRDKWVFYLQLKKAEIRCAIDTSLERDFGVLKDRFGLPFLLKPRRGFGSKGIVRVEGPETFLKYRDEIGPLLMVQPIIGCDEQEYTISAFCDGNGGFSACMALRRRLSRDGFTDKAEVVDWRDFVETLAELCLLFSPVGPTNFQFRMVDAGPKLLEINPRISSATSIRTAFGYNECAMAVDYFLKHRTPPQPPIQYGRAVRYTDEKIFYEDGIYL